jgi:hypothetical protein
MTQPALSPAATSFLAALQMTAATGAMRRGMTYEGAAQHAGVIIDSFEAAMRDGFIESIDDGKPCLEPPEQKPRRNAPARSQGALI